MRSKYIENLLVPSTTPTSIPDDIIRRHTVRQETVTYNLNAKKAGTEPNAYGVIVLYPNSPASFLGTHFSGTGGGKYKFDTNIYTAQDLPQNYNYSRKISQKIDIISSTIPSGVYALNGTINAITYEGAPSEVSPFTYDSLLSNTSNELDKVGNVLVGDGVTIIGLPSSFDIPFYRLADRSPFDHKGPVTTNLIADSDMNLYQEYTAAGPWVDSGSNYNFGTFNIDSPGAITIEGRINGPVVEQLLLGTGGSSDPPRGTIQVWVTFINVVGGDITTRKLIPGAIPDVPTGKIDPTSWEGVTITGGVDAVSIKANGVLTFSTTYNGPAVNENGGRSGSRQPVAAVRVALRADSKEGTTVTVPDSSTLHLKATLHSCAYPGFTNTITYVAYQGMAPDSVLTLSGLSNFELIPNPQLLKNLRTSYGHINPADMNYAKRLLSYRDEMQLRTIYRTSDYLAKLPLFSELSDIEARQEFAEAAGLGDIIRFIQRPLASIAGSIIPGADSIVNTIGDTAAGILGGLTGSSAGGRPVSRSAGGMAISATRPRSLVRAILGRSAARPLLNQYHRMAYSADHEHTAMINNLSDTDSTVRPSIGPTTAQMYAPPSSNPITQIEPGGLGPQILPIGRGGGPARAIPFPVLYAQDGRAETIHGGVYVAVPGDHRDLLPTASRTHISHSRNGQPVYGLNGPDYPRELDQPVTLLPATNLSPDTVVVAREAPPVHGSSCQTSTALAANAPDIVGVPDIAFTGGVTNRDRILPNPFVPMKLLNLSRAGLSLAANSPSADVPITSLAQGRQLLTQPRQSSIRYLRRINAPTHQPIGDMAHAMDDSEELPLDLPPDINTAGTYLHPDLAGPTTRIGGHTYSPAIAPVPTPPPPDPTRLQPCEAARVPAGHFAHAADVEETEEAGAPITLPPPPTTTIEDMIDDWELLGQRISESSPAFRDFQTVLLWITENDLTEDLARWMARDPAGHTLRTILTKTQEPTPGSRSQHRTRGTPLAPESRRGPTTDQAQAAKAERIAAAENQNGYPVDADWVAENGYRGLSSTQRNHYRRTGALPPPERPPTTDEGLALVIAKSMTASEEPPQRLVDEALTIIRGNAGRGPNNDQMQQLRAIAEELGRPAAPAARRARQRAATRAPPTAPPAPSAQPTSRFRRMGRERLA